MADLSNQKINQSFDGLLQVQGGLSQTQTPVTDGDGAVLPIEVSSRYVNFTSGFVNATWTSSTRPGNPTVGQQGYNTETGTVEIWSGSTWANNTFGTFTVQDFSGDGSTRVFYLSVAPAGINNTNIYVNGLYQEKNSYTVVGTTLTFNSAPASGTNNIEVVIGEPTSIDCNSLNYTAPFTGAVTESVEAKLSQTVSVKDFGALGDGTSDDRHAFVSADAVGCSIYVPKGNYYIGSSITITNHVFIPQGSIIVIPNGVTVTFNGGITANVAQIFVCTGTGQVVFSSQTQAIGYPEWWGAQTNNASFNCLPALNACYQAVTKTILQNAEYYITSTWNLNLSNKIVEGVIHNNMFSVSATSGSQIVSTSSTADVILLGLSSDPGTMASFVENVTLNRFGTYRTVPVTPPAVGSEAYGASGIRAQYVLNVLLEDVYTLNNSIGFNISNTVYSHFERCISYRNTYGNSSTNDIYWGFFLNGGLPYYLESVYFIDCSSLANPVAYGQTIGVASAGSFTDISLLRIEVDGHQYGMLINGYGETKPSIDNSIVGCVLDQNTIYGILIENQATGSSFKLVDNYCVMNVASSAVAAYGFLNNAGMATLTANEGLGYAGATAVGLYISNSFNIMSQGNNWGELTRPVLLSTATSCYISDNILNLSQTASQAAIVLTNNSARNVIDSNINGKTNAFPAGVNCDATTVACEIRCSGINAGGISGTTSNTLIYNGTQVTTGGTFGTTNMATGIPFYSTGGGSGVTSFNARTGAITLLQSDLQNTLNLTSAPYVYALASVPNTNWANAVGFQLGSQSASIFGTNINTAGFANNVYFDSSNNYRYLTSSTASILSLGSASFYLGVATSGTANSLITWNEIIQGSATGITMTVPLTVNGLIQSTSGGIKFPDGTTQTTAATGGSSGVSSFNTRTGAVTLLQTDIQTALNSTSAPYIYGLATTPNSGWANAVGFQLGSQTASVFGTNFGTTGLGNNLYVDNSNNYRYLTSSTATLLTMGTSSFYFGVATSGTAGNIITWNQVLQGSSTSITTTVPIIANGLIQSTSGGFKFPDGTTQTTAAGSGGVTSFNTRTGAVTLLQSDVTSVLAGATISGNLTTQIIYATGLNASSGTITAGLNTSAGITSTGGNITISSGGYFSGPGTGLTGTAASLSVGYATSAGSASSSTTTAQTSFSTLTSTTGLNLSAASSSNQYGVAWGSVGTINIKSTGNFQIVSSSTPLNHGGVSDGSYCHYFFNGSTAVGAITPTGTYTAISDGTLKSNQQPLTYGLADVLKLQPKSYTFDPETTQREALGLAPVARIGLISQEVKAVIPEAAPDLEGSVGLDYNALIPVLINAIHELSAEIDALKAKA